MPYCICTYIKLFKARARAHVINEFSNLLCDFQKKKNGQRIILFTTPSLHLWRSWAGKKICIGEHNFYQVFLKQCHGSKPLYPMEEVEVVIVGAAVQALLV